MRPRGQGSADATLAAPPASLLTVLPVYALLCLLWSSSWLAIKISLHGVAPILGAGLRTLIAAAVFFVLLAVRRQPLGIPPEARRFVALTAICVFTVPYTFVYVGETYITSGLTGVLYGSLPLFAALLAGRLLPNEPLTLAKTAGVVIGIAGLALVFDGSLSIDGSAAAVLAMCGIVLGAASQAYAQVRAKLAPQLPIPLLLGWATGIAGVLLLTFGLLFEPRHVDANFRTLGVIVYLALGSSVLGFTMNYWLLPRIGALALGLVYQVTPLLALFQSWAFYGEPVNLTIVLGAVVVVGGISLASGVVGFGRAPEAAPARAERPL